MDIKIRHAKPEDYKDLHEVHSQPNVISGTLQLPFPSEEMWKQRLAGVSEGKYILVAESGGLVIGGIWLIAEANLRRKHAAYIGMVVHDDWQKQGIGSSLLSACLDLADNWLNLIRIELSVFTDNEAAIHLYKKYGFVQEGILKSYAFREGSYQDVVSMARLKLPVVSD